MVSKFLIIVGAFLFSLLVQAEGPSCSALFEEPSLSHFQPLPRGNFSAQWEDRTVFLKRLRAGGIREYEWLQQLNALGLAVRTHGIFERDSQQYIILDFVQGINTQMPLLAPSNFRLTRPIQTEMKRQAQILADAGIIPVDLQFQITPQGDVVIIDPELFRKATSLDEAAKQTQNILKQIFLTWALEEKLD